MNSILGGILSSQVPESWLATLFRASWQGGLMIALVWAAICAMPFIRPGLRCWLWRLAAMKLVISLFWAMPVHLPLLPAITVAHHEELTAAISPAQTIVSQFVSKTPVMTVSQAAAPAVADKPPLWPMAICLIWTIGILIGFARIWRGFYLVRRLRARTFCNADEMLQDEIAKLCSSMGISVPPKIARSKDISSPLLTGIIDPIIIFPAKFIVTDRRHLEIILAHELAHLRRRDLGWGLLMNVVGVIFFYHPLVWLLLRESRLSSEAACDAEAIRITAADAKSYADLLIGMAAYQSGYSVRGIGVIGIVETVSSLRKRIGLVVNAKRVSNRTMLFAEAFAITIAFFGLCSWQVVHRTMADEVSPAATRPTGNLLVGTVVRPDGKPAIGATVCLETDDGLNQYDPTLIARADADGRFSINIPTTTRLSEKQQHLFAFLPEVGFSEPVSWTASSAQLIKLETVVDFQATFAGPDGKPVSGLHVWPAALTFYPSAAGLGGFSYLAFADDVSRQWIQTTDAEGKCTLRGFPRGAFVKFDTDDERYAEMTFKDRVLLESPDAIMPQTIHLTYAGTIIGKVINSETGKSVAGVAIDAQGAIEAQGMNVGWGRGITDTDGRFVLKRLISGKYIVSLSNPSDADGDWTARAVEVEAIGNQTVHTAVTLVPGGFVKGKVRDAMTGKGIPGISIGLYGPSMPMSASGVLTRVTDKDGAFSFRVAPGEQSIYVSGQAPAGYLPPSRDFVTREVNEGATATVNFDLQLDRTPGIRGQILDPSGKPAAGATIVSDDPQSPDPMGSPMAFVSDDAGRFHIAHVDTGCQLRVRWKDMATPKPIEIDSDHRDLTIHLSASAIYSLSVHVAGSNGEVIPNATVSLGIQNGRFGSGGEPMHVNKDGNVAFDALETDTNYYLWVEAPGYGVFQSPVTPPASGDLGKRSMFVELRAATSVISGTVVDSKGAPAPNVVVNYNGSETGAGVTKTDANGKFEFKVVPSAHSVLVYVTDKTNKRGPPLSADAAAGDRNIKLILGQTK